MASVVINTRFNNRKADYTFKAYFSNVGDELLRKKGAKNYWKGLTVNFIAKEPART